ncbi:hypothetical protein [Embleya scabrispora]|uniref:hypothetical protein n=1 Tax=Embleya scabrispora TaxID=159449 RepID=UPI0003671C3A|nr:hypothetical protein [Embleya scabrispora]MYS84075.1 hypothetical protein [Streptomyces sp. SID5474]
MHDDRVPPALGRLYLTATPRVWEPADVSAYGEGTGRGDTGRLPLDADDDVWDDPDTTATDDLENDGADRDDRADEDEDFDNRNNPEDEDDDGARPARIRGGRPIHSSMPARTIASMDDEAIYGPTVHRLELAAGCRLGLLARPRIVVVDVADPTVRDLAAAGDIDLNRGPGRRSLEEAEEYRAARLAALQAAVLRVAAELGLSTVIAYHARTAEAQACAETLPDVAKRLHESDPGTYPERCGRIGCAGSTRRSVSGGCWASSRPTPTANPPPCSNSPRPVGR